MQRKNIETLKANLLSNLDDDCNVINVEGALAAVNELLEHHTTQEELEQTRLGKYVNEFRKKTSHGELSKKAKDLLRKYQVIVNQAAGTNNISKKDVPQAKNGTHVNGPLPVSLQNISKVPDDKGHVNGKIKISTHPISFDKNKERPSQPKARDIPSSSSNNSLQNVSVPKNGLSSVGMDSHKKAVHTQDLSYKATVAPYLSKNSSVINGSNSPKVTCDIVSATEKKRRLDVPSVNSDYTNPKRTKLESSIQTPLPGMGKLNGIVSNSSSENKVFSCKVSPDLKCTIRSESIKPAAVSSPSLSIKSSSSKQELNKSDVVNKPRKVETTEQLIQKLRKNGELCSMPSQTIYKLTNNQIAKEHISETTVVPNESKPKSHKKRSKPQPPATGDLTEVKNELVQKFLRTSISSTNNRPFSEPPEIEDSKIDCTSITVPVDVSKLDPNSDEYKKELLRNPWAFLPAVPEEEVICNHEDESQMVLGHSPTNVDDVLNGHKPGLNGQYDFKNEWKPFNKAYSVTNSCNTYLNIMPYVCLY